METVVETKICKRCGKELSIDNFWKSTTIKDGYFNTCKTCAIDIKDENSLKKQKHLKQNLWTCSTCNRDLPMTKEHFHKRNDNSTGFQSRCKICVKTNKRNTTRALNKDDLNLFIYDNFFNAQYRANKKNIEFTISLQYLKDLWLNQKGKCALTGLNMTHIKLEGKVKTNLSIDRIDPNLGYIEGNVQLVCNIVNIMKSDMNIENLKYYCNLILQSHD